MCAIIRSLYRLLQLYSLGQLRIGEQSLKIIMHPDMKSQEHMADDHTVVELECLHPNPSCDVLASDLRKVT